MGVHMYPHCWYLTHHITYVGNSRRKKTEGSSTARKSTGQDTWSSSFSHSLPAKTMGTCRQGIPRHHMFPPEISRSVGFQPACSVVVEATPLIQMPGTKSGAMMILTPSMCQPLLVLTCLTIQNGPWCWNHRFWWPPSSVGFHRFPWQTAGLCDFNSCSGLEDV